MNKSKNQTHIRVFKSDRVKLHNFMKKKSIKSQASAIRILLRRALR